MTVFVLGLDGASQEQLRCVMKKTKLPNFEKIFKEGFVSDLLSVYPYVTAPAWTTIFSGVNPGKHGIFEMYEIVGNSIQPSNMRNAEVPFLWDYLSWARKKTLALGIPFIYPAPRINGIFVTGRFVPKLSTYPEKIEEKFDLTGFQYIELPTEQGIENVLSQGSSVVSEKILEDLKSRIKSSLALIDSEKWDSVILVDNLPDEVLHISYDDENLVMRMFSELDEFLGQIIRRLTENDHLIVVSDHGFGGITNVFFINEWLRSKGYLVVKLSALSKILLFLGFNWDSLSKPGFSSRIYKTVLKYFPGLLKRTKESAAGGFMVEDSTKLSSDVSAFGINEPVAWIRCSKENVARNQEQVYSQLMELKQKGLLKNVFKTGDIFSGKYVENAIGQLLIEANRGEAIDASRLNDGRMIGKPLLTKKGVHERAGIFAYSGNARARPDQVLRIQDLTPTVLGLLGLPIPKDLDGVPIMHNEKDSSSTWKLDVTQSL